MFIRIVVTTAALVALTTIASAQSRPSNDPETNAIESYRLTLPVLQKIAAANKAFGAALKNDPAAQKQLEKDDDTGNGNESIGDMERRIAAMPHMTDALKSAGVSVHEYALFELCAFQAAMTAGLEKAGQLKSIPAGVQSTNVQFMKDHEKEFTAAMQQAGEQ
jgi:hypothetical protein